jgi:hypothetical protein
MHANRWCTCQVVLQRNVLHWSAPNVEFFADGPIALVRNDRSHMTLSRQTQPESVAFSIIMHLASILWCGKGEPDLVSHRSHSGYFHPVQNCLACPDNFWDNARAGLRIVAL